MPARRKSLAELEANGSLAKNPGRFAGRTNGAPAKGPLGKVPRHMSQEEKDVWHELVEQAPEGAFTYGDRLALETLVRMVMFMRAGKLTKQSELVSLFSTLARYGLTAEGRKQIDVPTQGTPADQDEDDFSDLD